MNGDGPPPGQIIEPRCNCCQHEQRFAIDRLIAIGTKYQRIAKIFDVSRDSIRNHAEKHLNYQDAAIREVILNQAEEMEKNIEEGVSGVLSQHSYLQVALNKAFEALLNGETVVEPKDAVNIIQLQREMQAETAAAGVETYQIQFNIIMQAMQETLRPEDLYAVRDRAQKLWTEARVEHPEIEPPKDAGLEVG